MMGIVSGFKHDLFISYAHFDNEADAQGVHWVSRFQIDLQNALRQRIGSDPEIFFDARNFEAGDHVDYLVDNVPKFLAHTESVVRDRSEDKEHNILL